MKEREFGTLGGLVVGVAGSEAGGGSLGDVLDTGLAVVS